MKKIIISVLAPFILLTTMALSCKKDEGTPVEPEPATHGSIKGSVVEFGSTNPLAMVNVYSVPPTSFVKTDSSGKYIINTVEPGEYQVVAAKIGFDTISVNVNVTAGAVTVADFILVNNGSKGGVQFGQISGTVFNSASFLPIGKVNLITLPATGSITTDDSGKFNFGNVPAGQYKLKAEKKGYDTTSVTVTVYGGNTSEADIYMDKSDTSNSFNTGTIIGNVKDSQSLLAINGALVSTNPATSSVFSKNDGSYRFENIEPGSYTIQVSKSGYQDASAQITVSAGKITQADFTLISKSGRVTGTVTDAATLQPVPGVNIQTQPATVSITTDTSGKFTLENISPATYTIKANVAGYLTASLSVVVTAGNVTQADISLTKIN